MVLGGDFNPGPAGKRPRAGGGKGGGKGGGGGGGGGGGERSLYAELTEAVARVYDSEDEWDEDADEGQAWPPSGPCALAADLWR
eukprot:2396361-Prymnesium_polylepis.1